MVKIFNPFKRNGIWPTRIINLTRPFLLYGLLSGTCNFHFNSNFERAIIRCLFLFPCLWIFVAYLWVFWLLVHALCMIVCRLLLAHLWIFCLLICGFLFACLLFSLFACFQLVLFYLHWFVDFLLLVCEFLFACLWDFYLLVCYFLFACLLVFLFACMQFFDCFLVNLWIFCLIVCWVFVCLFVGFCLTWALHNTGTNKIQHQLRCQL